MTPIPPEAEPVVKYIREHVPRPNHLPVPLNPERGTALRFGNRCPMGMIDGSKEPAPSYDDDFDPEVLDEMGIVDDEIWTFFSWWDQLTDPQSAVDAVWGTAKGATDET